MTFLVVHARTKDLAFGLKFLRFAKFLKFKSKLVEGLVNGHSHFFKIVCGSSAAHPSSKISALVRVEKVGSKIYALPSAKLHSSHAFNAEKVSCRKSRQSRDTGARVVVRAASSVITSLSPSALTRDARGRQ